MEKYRLSDLVKIKNGKDYKALNEGIYPVYGSGGLMLYVNKFLYDKPSVLLPRKGTLSNIQYYEEPFWTVDTIYYTEVNEYKVNPYYLYRYLRSLDLSGFDSGASIPSMTSKTYYGIKVELPDRAIQDKVAELLKEYDHLIENNTKRIKLLEQMAENLYKEWFVRFRFPGHEDVEFENGLPKGWKEETFDKIASFQNGYAFASSELLGQEEVDCYAVFKQGHIMRGGGFKVDGTKSWYPKSASSELNRFVLRKNDILMAMTDMKDKVAILGNTALLPYDNKYILNQRVGLIRPTGYEDAGFCYIYLLTNSFDFVQSLRCRANRGVQVNLSAEHIKSSIVVVPSSEVNVQFQKIANNIYAEIFNLIYANDNLIKQRDLLLPRLMSGKLEVK